MSAPIILVVSSVLVAQIEKELMHLPTQLQTDVVGLVSLLANLPLLGLFNKGHCQATKNLFISVFLIHPSFLMYYQLLTTLMLNLVCTLHSHTSLCRLPLDSMYYT